MNEQFAVITGANRRNGIGFSLVRVFRDNGWKVVGTYREPSRSEHLIELSRRDQRLHALQLDVTSDTSTAAFENELRMLTMSVEVLVNNAGMPATSGTIASAPIEALVRQMQVHAIGPIRVTQALLPLLEKSRSKPAKVTVISSTLGTIRGVGAGWTHYAPCKTAANALIRQMGAVLRARNISVFCLHPGWVETDIGGLGAPVSPQQSALGLYTVITSSSMRDSITFRNYQGAAESW